MISKIHSTICFIKLKYLRPCKNQDFMNLFYTKGFSTENNQLSDDEAKHCLKVLRRKQGDNIQVTDGCGKLFKGTLDIIGKKAFVNIISVEDIPKTRNYHLHIAIAPTKNIDRLEWFLEKCTEIGIDEVSLLLTSHSERKRVRFDRVEKIVLSAMKQSHQMHLPKSNDLIAFKDFIHKDFTDYQKFICHCEDEFPKLNLKQYPTQQKTLILIGPEGDFSLEEIKLAYEKEFKGLDLGINRLRTETAGIVACQNIQFTHYE